jgi:hypothetical protein
MGGPIKEGVMHGIREPYRGGGAALVGNPVYPQTGGREHHNLWLKAGNVAAPRIISKGMPHIKRGWQAFKNIFGKTKPSTTRQKYHGYGSDSDKLVYTTEKVPGSFVPKSWLARDPIWKSGKWVKEAITGPTAKGIGQKIVRGTATPTGALTAAGLTYGFWPDGTPKDSDAVTGVMKPGGYPQAKKKGQGIETGSRGDFAKAEREARVNKYLELMGYDRSKKMAVADALIDASKIVSDRGSLELKNINRELINPIIQATSARFDKPSQIREAVGLMATKAEIEKDLSKEKDALDTRLKTLQIEGAEEALKATQSFEGAMSKFISERKGKVDKVTLERISRLFAKEHEEPFKKVTGDEEVTTDGIYMKDGNLYRVTGGVSQQLV